VGRAGRDGEPASCHLFLDDADFLRLRSLAHSDGVDAPAIAAFLRAAFDAEVSVQVLACLLGCMPARIARIGS
jgi:ATP-dependent DNA helicase Q4